MGTRSILTFSLLIAISFAMIACGKMDVKRPAAKVNPEEVQKKAGTAGTPTPTPNPEPTPSPSPKPTPAASPTESPAPSPSQSESPAPKVDPTPASDADGGDASLETHIHKSPAVPAKKQEQDGANKANGQPKKETSDQKASENKGADKADKREKEKEKNKPAPTIPLPPTRPDMGEQRKDQNEEATLNGSSLSKEEIRESGFTTPTVYFFPLVDDDKSVCAKPNTPMTDSSGKILAQVCSETFDVCAEQGSCAIVDQGKTLKLNVHGQVNGTVRFFEIGAECPFGYGVDKICLDPFYSVAADLSIYKPGDVIYIPSLSGLALPNGQKHNGVFIVRDQGRGVKGVGRFDFFSGFLRWKNSENPFTKVGLTDKKTRLTYYILKGERAEKMRLARQFPKLNAAPIRATDRPIVWK